MDGHCKHCKQTVPVIHSDVRGHRRLDALQPIDLLQLVNDVFAQVDEQDPTVCTHQLILGCISFSQSHNKSNAVTSCA